jgi:site-specific recombinase XerD
MGIQWGKHPDEPPACSIQDRDLQMGRGGQRAKLKSKGARDDDAGLRGVSAHVLRHTFASILIYQGRDVAFVAAARAHDAERGATRRG